jgi:hypothetical protein
MNFAFFHSAAQKNGEQQQPHTKQNGGGSVFALWLSSIFSIYLIQLLY